MENPRQSEDRTMENTNVLSIAMTVQLQTVTPQRHASCMPMHCLTGSSEHLTQAAMSLTVRTAEEQAEHCDVSPEAQRCEVVLQKGRALTESQLVQQSTLDPIKLVQVCVTCVVDGSCARLHVAQTVPFV